MSQAAFDFVSAITGDAGAPALFQILPDHRGSDVEPAGRFGRLADLLPALKRFNAEGAGIFLTINKTKGSRRKREDIVAARALFIDSDGTPMPGEWKLAPSLIATRANPGKWHAYWRLKPGEDVRRWPAAQRALAEIFGTDPAICDLPRVMRVPGFKHLKNPEAPDVYRVAVQTEGAWTIDEVMTAHGIDPATIIPEVEPVDALPLDPDAAELSEADRATLLEAMGAISRSYARNPKLSRDKLIGGWIMDAVGAGMDSQEIDEKASAWLVANGREPQRAEIANWIRSARGKFKTGKATIRTPGLRIDTDFDAVLQAPDIEEDETPAATAAPDPDWMQDVPATKEGAWKSHVETVRLICSKDSRLRECFAYNLFTDEVEVNRAPWRDWTGTRQWEDGDIQGLTAWIARAFQDRRPTLTPEHVHAGVCLVARANAYHPIRDYLRRHVWDGVKRLDTWLTTYFGVEASDYSASVGAKTLMAAVRRIMNPGCKFDTVLILEGIQGAGKSRALEALASPWFSSETIVIGDKDSLLAMRRSWIHELGELDTLRRAEVNELKAFLSRGTDRVRDPYQRMTVDRPRQGILIGTTNKDEYLKDETGGRRFWPVRCPGAVDVAGLERDRDQLWAETLKRAESGESLWLDNATIREAAEEAQEGRRDEDVWLDEIAGYLADTTGFGGKAETVKSVDIFRALNPGASIGAMTDTAAKRIASAMKRLGWRKEVRRINGGVCRVYVRGKV